jgi:hypothetical protein
MQAHNQGRSNRNAFGFLEIIVDSFFDHTGLNLLYAAADVEEHRRRSHAREIHRGHHTPRLRYDTHVIG